jgi:hypothetical protein
MSVQRECCVCGRRITKIFGSSQLVRFPTCSSKCVNTMNHKRRVERRAEITQSVAYCGRGRPRVLPGVTVGDVIGVLLVESFEPDGFVCRCTCCGATKKYTAVYLDGIDVTLAQNCQSCKGSRSGRTRTLCHVDAPDPSCARCRSRLLNRQRRAEKAREVSCEIKLAA